MFDPCHSVSNCFHVFRVFGVGNQKPKTSYHSVPPRYSSKASFAGGMGMDDDEGPEFRGWVVILNLVQLCAASCEVIESKRSGFGCDVDEEN